MFILAGLGNPGSRYAGHRHNIGFMAIDAIAEAHGFSAFTAKFQGQLAEGKIGGERVFLFKPMQFMNVSGPPLSQLAQFYKIPPEHIGVLHDELDLPLGKLRVKRGGGNGGHNGLKSIDAHLGQDYQRVRLGIAHPGDKDRVADYVLSDFTKDEMKTVEPWLAAIAKHAGLLIAGDEPGFMNKVTLALPVGAPKKEETSQ